jgi:DNA-binding MarR family transcriptional regulator
MSRSAPGPEELAGLLLRVVGLLRDRLDAEAVALGLSSRQGLALLHLGGPTTMRELAACLRCDASNVTSVADRLEALGLVERAGAAGDRRVKQLVLTPRGIEARGRLQRRLAARDCALAALGPESRRALAELLARVAGPAVPPGAAGRPRSRGDGTAGGPAASTRSSRSAGARSGARAPGGHPSPGAQGAIKGSR